MNNPKRRIEHTFPEHSPADDRQAARWKVEKGFVGTINGWLHQFGIVDEGKETVAIIEKEDGVICEVYPTEIQFKQEVPQALRPVKREFKEPNPRREAYEKMCRNRWKVPENFTGTVTGEFHRFIQVGDGNCPDGFELDAYAIVEKPDGVICQVYATEIQFTDQVE